MLAATQNCPLAAKGFQSFCTVWPHALPAGGQANRCRTTVIVVATVGARARLHLRSGPSLAGRKRIGVLSRNTPSWSGIQGLTVASSAVSALASRRGRLQRNPPCDYPERGCPGWTRLRNPRVLEDCRLWGPSARIPCGPGREFHVAANTPCGRVLFQGLSVGDFGAGSDVKAVFRWPATRMPYRPSSMASWIAAYTAVFSSSSMRRGSLASMKKTCPASMVLITCSS